MPRKPVALVILDGYGIAPDFPGNAIARAHKPYLDQLAKEYPVVALHASGEAVGLPWGEMGNSEVGHIALGAGKILYQDRVRIDKMIADGSFLAVTAFQQAIYHAKENGGTLHLIGMLSPGGVHSHISHLWPLMDLAAAGGVPFAVHGILDGRDMPFDSGKDFISETLEKTKSLGGRFASLSGRYYAMDRDNRWERTVAAYRACLGIGPTAKDPSAYVAECYAKGTYDEQIPPVAFAGNDGKPVAPVKAGDAAIFFNFRPDRARQLAKAFVLPALPVALEGDAPKENVENLYFVSMTEYEAGLPLHVALPPEHITEPLAKVLSDNGKTQVHIAETEKYAHVTFFFNGGREEPFPGEERVMVPSPKVASYDQAPEMSAGGITKETLARIARNEHDFYVINFANPDMVAHTGNLKASVEAVEETDVEVQKITEAVLALGGTVFITADHGNAEGLTNPVTGDIDKEHSTSPVPLFLVSKEWKGKTLPLPDAGEDMALAEPVGMLADVAPTILHRMGIPIPPEMTGTSLLTD